jgi:hypothetical protein
MHKKTVSKLIVSIIMTMMLIAILPTLPVQAVALTGITPVSGNVGTEVRVLGTIDTQGGVYSIYFDTNGNGNALDDGAIVTGNAPANSYAVNDTFTVPPCLGSDAGSGHLVLLRDEQTLGSQSTSFAVITERTITTAAYDQEGDTVALTITVTGGTTANTLNNFTVGVTAPDGTMYTDANFSFSTDGAGSGSVTKNFPSATFTAGAHTNFTGTYMVVANRTLPGIITDAASTSFIIGVTDMASYGRFETVNFQTSGWVPNQNISVTVTDPSDAVVSVPWPDVVNVTTGALSANWIIPWNAPIGTYTVTVANETGNNKAIESIQTFEVGTAELTVTFTSAPAVSPVRTDTVTADFTIQYPNSSYLTNGTDFESITVRVYYNTTMVAEIPLTAAEFAANTWTVTWKIPRDAVLGNNYKFHLDEDTIFDTYDNHGPSAATPSASFTISAADLAVGVTQQPAANYTRTSFAMAKMNITYPDDTFFTDADLGSVLVRVYQGATNVANVSLVAGDFNATTNEWTVMWASPYDATLAADYTFQVLINEAMDAANNMGPTADASTNTFELLAATIAVDAINTDASSYAPGEYVQISFTALYGDGSPVVTGTSTITLWAPDGFTTSTYNPVHGSAGTWGITIWLSDAQAQIGEWMVMLAANGINDGAGNSGPAAAINTTFTVMQAEVTLETLLAAIEDLSDDVDDLDAAVSSLDSALAALESRVGAVEADTSALSASVVALAELITDLQADLDACCATSASASDVAAVEADVAALRAHLDALLADAASETDVAAVSAAVDDLNTALDAVEGRLDAAIADAATKDDLDAAQADLSDEMSEAIGGVNTMVIVAVVLALIAAVAAILAVYIIQRKIAG